MKPEDIAEVGHHYQRTRLGVVTAGRVDVGQVYQLKGRGRGWYVIGVDKDTGKQITLRPSQILRRVRGAAPPAVRRPTIAEFCKLRGFGGFNARGATPPDYLSSMRATGATLARLWYTAVWDGQRYTVSPEQRAVMTAGLVECRALGLSVVVALSIERAHMPWDEPAMLAAYRDLCAEVAGWHADQLAAVAIDGMNEPETREYPITGGWTHEQFVKVEADWRALAAECAAEVAKAAPGMLFVYQVGLGAYPPNFAWATPLLLPNVVHSAHQYYPHSFTHQHAHVENPGYLKFLAYLEADKEALDWANETIASWSRRHGGLPVYFGEFSATRYAPGADEYVRQVVDFCDAQGWPWTYHGWREWYAWDAEADGPAGDNRRRPDAPRVTMLKARMGRSEAASR